MSDLDYEQGVAAGIDTVIDALDALVIEYIALALETNQPLTYRLNPALVQAAALVAKLRGEP